MSIQKTGGTFRNHKVWDESRGLQCLWRQNEKQAENLVEQVRYFDWRETELRRCPLVNAFAMGPLVLPAVAVEPVVAAMVVAVVLLVVVVMELVVVVVQTWCDTDVRLLW